MNKPGKYREKEMSNESDLTSGGFFEEAPDVATIISSLEGHTCDVAGDIEVVFSLDVDTSDAKVAHTDLSFINTNLERSEIYISIRA